MARILTVDGEVGEVVDKKKTKNREEDLYLYWSGGGTCMIILCRFCGDLFVLTWQRLRESKQMPQKSLTGENTSN